jgi:TonB-dependent receptor
MRFNPKRLPITSRALFTIVGGAVLINPAFAQDQQGEEIDTVVVTGIRGSLQASMNLKRDATGVVDAITAEDIGKFPDTNLAESLQRITGVSIDRVNGEGSRITARGFGPGFNMVTLNGRAMPTADVVVVGSGGDGEYGTFTSRAFDMSNIASEGVSGIEVYKTGRAGNPSGGIGATINMKTLRPLEAGTRLSLGGKAVHDASVESGSEVTPEFSGLASWSSANEKFGVAAFFSYSKRESASVGASNQDWNVERLSSFLDVNNGRVRLDNPATVENEATQFTNLPSGNPLVVFPNNSDYFFSEVERERLNGHLTLQFRPMESLTLTADALRAENEAMEQRTSQGNWFNRPFAQVTFDTNPEIASVIYLQESLTSPKDIAWGQQLRNTKDELESYGLNAEWQLSDRFKLTFDGHQSEAKSLPNGPGGMTSYDFGTGVAGIASHSLDNSSGFPVQDFVYDDDDGPTCNAQTRVGCRNDNGIIDIADVSSSVGRTSAQFQVQEIDEYQLDGEFAFTESTKLTAGVNKRKSTMGQARFVTAQVLGDWGVLAPGDIDQAAPGALEAFCLSCLYDDFSPGDGQVAFRGNAATLLNAVSPVYLDPFWGDPLTGPHRVQTWNNDINAVEEDITAVFAEFAWDTEIGGRPANFNVGVRYEKTDVTSATVQAVPTNVIWTADNDFAQDFGGGGSSIVTAESDYDHFLPNLDFSIELIDNVMVRASYSKTIGRNDFGFLFAGRNAGTPPRATALGVLANGSRGNPGLVPLESSNFDVSIELYYDEASYLSLGFFDKHVDNFQGTGVFSEEMFGLRDPSSGAPGTRSGQASALIPTIPGAVRNDVNLFVLTAMIDNPQDFPDPVQAFLDNSTNGVLNQAFADQIFGAYDIVPDASDPLFQFRVTQPINQEKANIRGVELAFQHFFGDSGFGLQGNYTIVDGDVAFNDAGEPGVNQFALDGLSDTANATFIYEKHGFSARLAWNYRAEFLSGVNRGGFTNPTYTDAFRQWDLNVSYDVSDALQISLEAVNLTGEDIRTFGRARTDYWFAQDLHPRYLLGARYRFE